MNTDYHEDQEDQDEERRQRLNSLGAELAKRRSSAIQARKNSGIEDIWRSDEEYYEGIDDLNRGSEASSAWGSKPMGQGVIGADDDGDNEPGSTVFFNITAPYCDAASAKMGDMAIPNSGKTFAIKPTPIPDLISISTGNFPAAIEKQIEEAPEFAPELDPDGQAKAKTKQDVIDSVKQEISQAIDSAEKAEARMHDWLVECQYAAEARQVIDDVTKVGSGVMKGPVPEQRESRAYKEGGLIVQSKIQPVYRQVNYWNLFPDGACGQSIHDGSYIFERDDISKRRLRDLMKDPTYIVEEIQACLDEGPHEAKGIYDATSDNKPGLDQSKEGSQYEIWYYYGHLESEDMEAAGCECDESEDIPAHIIMVNNRVIKASMNHLETGDFPYDVMVWQRRKSEGIPWGIGISRKIRVAQRIINAAMRAMMNNAGLASGPMWAYLQGLVFPQDGYAELAPRKGWFAAADADIDDIRKAFTFFDMDMHVEELLKIVEIGLKLAEDITGLPMLLQGQQGKAPDTVGVTQILNNNASSAMRRFARLFDDMLIEPGIRRLYSYLLQYGEDDSEKGDFVVEALGSSALVEMDIQNQSIAEMAQLVLNPAYKKDPAKWIDKYLISKKLNPEDFDYDDEDWEKLVQMILNPQDSSMQLAELKYRWEAEKQAKQQEFEARRDEREAEIEMAFKQIDTELSAAEQQLKQAQQSGDMQKHNDAIRAHMAEVISKLKVQLQLSGSEAITPLVEPQGRAEPGKSFQD